MQTHGELHIVQTKFDAKGWSKLCSEKDFWSAFFRDLKACSASLTIVSPLITNDATWKIANELKELKARGVEITVYTRLPEEHQNRYGFNLAHARLKKLAAEVKMVSKIHQRLAIIDEFICWEGSLNILGFRDSREQMRRFQSTAAKHLLGQLATE